MTSAALAAGPRVRRTHVLVLAILATLALSMAVSATSAQAATRYVCADSVTFRKHTDSPDYWAILPRNHVVDVDYTVGAFWHGATIYTDPSTGGAVYQTGYVLIQYMSSTPC